MSHICYIVLLLLSPVRLSKNDGKKESIVFIYTFDRPCLWIFNDYLQKKMFNNFNDLHTYSYIKYTRKQHYKGDPI